MARNLKTVPKFIDEDYPNSEGSFRWLMIQREINGLDAMGVVVKIAGRLYVDTDRWDDWVDAQQEQSPAPA